MEKLNLILDTDVGSDCDDMMSLAYLVYAQKFLNTSITAITYSNGCEFGPATIQAFLKSMGTATLPIGLPNVPVKKYDNYCRQIVEKFGGQEVTVCDAVELMRRTLVENENNIICGIGALTNIAALLNSKADEISSLDGVELVKEKCKKVVLMAGKFNNYNENGEWNVRLDIPAAQAVVEKCPVPLVFLPFETGFNVISGGPIMQKYGESNPLSLSFCLFPGVKDSGGRHSWDPITTIYAVEGCKDLLTESEPGIVSINDEGKSFFTPDNNGLHTYLTVKVLPELDDKQSRKRIADYIDECALNAF